MQYSPKLKKAMEQIKDILKENDIAAFVLLHDSDFSEYLNHLETSHSCATSSPEGLRVKLKTDLMGKERAEEMAKKTFNMITHFADVLAKHAMVYIECQKNLAKRWGGTQGPASATSHTEQNS